MSLSLYLPLRIVSLYACTQDACCMLHQWMYTCIYAFAQLVKHVSSCIPSHVCMNTLVFVYTLTRVCMDNAAVSKKKNQFQDAAALKVVRLTRCLWLWLRLCRCLMSVRVF